MKKVFTLFAMLVMFTSVALADVIEITVQEEGFATKFYAADNDLYIMMADDPTNPTYVFYFDIVCETGETDIHDNTMYTLDDMIADYSVLADYNAQAYVGYKSVTLVRADGVYDVSVTDSADRQFHLTYTVPVPITEVIDTVWLSFTNKDYTRLYDATADAGVFQLYGQDDDDEYYFYFAVQNATQVPGTYTYDNVYTDYTTLYHYDGGDTTEIKFSNILSDVIVRTLGDSTTAVIEYVGRDSVLYIMYYKYADPTAETVIVIQAENLTISQNANYDLYELYYGVYAYDAVAADENYVVYVTTFNAEYDIPYGQYDYADGYVNIAVYTNDADYEEVGVEVFSGEADVAKNGNETSLVGQVLYYGDVYCSFSATGEATAVENVEASEYDVYSEGRTIVLNGAEGQNAAIYDMAGRMISNTMVNSDNARFEVAAAGVYVVRVNGQTFRAVVK